MAKSVEAAEAFFSLASELWGDYVLTSQREACHRLLVPDDQGLRTGVSDAGADSSFLFVCQVVAIHRLLYGVNDAINAAGDAYDRLSEQFSAQLMRLAKSNIAETARGCLSTLRLPNFAGMPVCVRLTCLIEEVFKSCSSEDEKFLGFLQELLAYVQAEMPSLPDYIHTCGLAYCPLALGLVPTSAGDHFGAMSRLYDDVVEEYARETSEAIRLKLYKVYSRLSRFYWAACLSPGVQGGPGGIPGPLGQRHALERMCRAVENLGESLARLEGELASALEGPTGAL